MAWLFSALIAPKVENSKKTSIIKKNCNSFSSKTYILKHLENLFYSGKGEEEEEDLRIKEDNSEGRNEPVYHHSECESQCHKKSQLTECTGRCPSRPSLIRSVSDVGRNPCQHLAAYNAKCKGKSLPDLATKCSEELCEYRPEKMVRYKVHYSTKESDTDESK